MANGSPAGGGAAEALTDAHDLWDFGRVWLLGKNDFS